MAKWGEGDPRWIVEERADAKNVNNWHWTEKDATAWSKQRITDLLTNLAFEDGDASARISEVQSVVGECSLNNRKAKLICFYELVLKLKWKGQVGEGGTVSGTIEIPNLSEENDMDEIDFVISSDSSSPDKDKLRNLVKRKGTDLIRIQLKKWKDALTSEYARDLVLPTKDKTAGAAAAPAAPTEVAKVASEVSGVKIHTEKVADAGIQPRSFEFSEDFQCTPGDLFLALVDAQRIRAYTMSDAAVDAKVGGKFHMFGGNVSGIFKDIIPNIRIVQAWRFSHWVEGHFSEVTINLSETKSGTRLTLKHTNVPFADLERVKEGWKSNQFERMKMVLGFGTSIGAFM